MYLWKILRSKFLKLTWLCVALLPASGAGWLRERQLPSLLMWVVVAAYLLYCGSTFYVCIRTIRHLDEDPAISIWAALRRSCGSLWLLLGFVPVVGSFFEPDEDKTRYDPDE
jgi:hypothetical protein